MNEEVKRLLKAIGFLSTVGLAMVLSIVIGVSVGYYLDRWLKTKPIFFYTFLVIGIAAAFRSLYVFYKRGKKIFE